MIAATNLRLVLVTPETTVIDRTVRSIVVPLFDGQMGLLPGRAPVVGRLGTGELRFDGEGSQQSYFIDGGFLQVKGSVVSVLTHHARPADQIDLAAAESELEQAASQIPTTEEALLKKQHAQDRARKMIALRRRSS